MKMTTLKVALLSTTLVATSAMAEDVTLTIESWRNDDLALWQDQIIPAFEAANPGIKVKFTPSAPTEYNAVLNSKLEAGSAGDLITCRPFDASLRFTMRATWPICPAPPRWQTSLTLRNPPGKPMTAPPRSACQWPP